MIATKLNKPKLPLSALVAAICTAISAASPPVLAQQMAPTGYSGAINTPTADVLPWGSATLSYSNSIPERASQFPTEPFGGINAGFGVLPGLEIVGRLAFDGNTNCSLYEFGCKGRTRDLSVGAKYQLPLKLPLDSRVALGFTDYGGAATQFRSAYGVATSILGPVDVSLGYAKKASNTALLDGLFGSAVLHVTDQFQVMAESDGQARRVGGAFTQPLNDRLAFQLGVSRKVSGAASQKNNQVTASVQYFFEKQATRARPGQRKHLANGGSGPSTDRVQQNNQLTPQAQAQAMAAAFKKHGFSQVTVRHAPATEAKPATWQLIVEPVLKRHDQASAIGSALAIWLDHVGSAPSSLSLELTYMGTGYRNVSTTRDCVAGFAAGQSQCTHGPSLALGSASGTAGLDRGETLVTDGAELNFKPQFELGLDLNTSVGTELGLVDHSLALDVGMQLQLSKGFFWQGNAQLPVSRSDDYRNNGAFNRLGHTETRIDQALVSYVLPVTVGRQPLNTQVSAGSINAYSRGAQVDATWMDGTGFWRVGGTLGKYSRTRGNTRENTTPALLSVRRSILPGEWMVEGTFGEFLGGDRGWMFKSQHWFGDVGLSFYLQNSDGGTIANPRRKFAGFEISVPFGGLWQKDYGWASVRGMDRMAWGQKTKVGEADNVITGGYGEVPKPRHGVWTDFTDHDRSGTADAWAQRDRIRDAMNLEQ